MIKVTVELTFDDADIMDAKRWWKEQGFSSDSSLPHIMVSAAINDIGSPDFDVIGSFESHG
jgi:hypothetical protein